MFILKGFKGVRKLGKSHYSKYISTRFLSTENVALSEESPTVTRRYSKPVTIKELKVLKDTFLRSLFVGSMDKGIFNYPEVIRESDTDIVLNHSCEIENFLKNIPKNSLSDDIITKLRELELFGLSVPQKYGGAGYNETECKFVQECTGGNPRIGRFLGYNENFGCKLLNLYGTEEQKQKYLPRLARGESFVSLAYIENGPLVNLISIEGNAINDEVNKQYILNAKKKWVHNADRADLFFVVVKAAEFFDADAIIGVNFNVFIVEKDMPGVTVHKLKSEYAQENDLYDVSFKDVVVPQENVLGNFNKDGFEIVKTALSHVNVTDAALCCNLIKRINHDAIQFIQERSLVDTSMKAPLVQESIASLVMYLYALESVVYLVTGRYDTFDNPDLFFESIFAKALAVDLLQAAVKKYIEILGRESFLSTGLLEEATKTIQYYSVFDENIEYLKLMAAAEGLTYAARKLSHTVKILRNPFDNNWEAFKRMFTTEEIQKRKIKAKHNFKLELQEFLALGGDFLDESVARFEIAIEKIFIEDGAALLKNEHMMIKFGEIAAYLYALAATLSRASSSLCYDFPGAITEYKIAEAFAYFVNSKTKEIYNEEIEHKNLLLYYKDLGEETMNRKEYPVEHPLSRTF